MVALALARFSLAGSNRPGLLVVMAAVVTLTLTTPTLASVKDCDTENCLFNAVLQSKDLATMERECSTLDNKQEKGLFKEDLGHLCRLHVARKRVSQRKYYACRPMGSRSSDFLFGESKIAVEELAKRVYLRIPKEHQVGPGLKTSSGKRTNDNTVSSTIHSTYRHSIRVGDLVNGKRIGYRFDVYYCVVGNKNERGYYQAYFFRYQRYDGKVDKSAKPAYTLQRYVAQPLLTDLMILRQLSKKALGDTHSIKSYQFVDVNGDKIKDLLFVRRKFGKGYGPGFCVYQPKKQECKNHLLDKLVKTKIFWVKPEVQIKGKKIIVLLKDSRNKKPTERHEYPIPRL